MPPRLRTRLSFVALALTTIALRLVVHLRGTVLSSAVRDVLGDALRAMMIFWWVAAAAPQDRLRLRGLAALALCWAVEASQLYHAPVLDGWRSTTVGHLLLGSGFEPRDLAAYALGVLAAVWFERAARGRPEKPDAAAGPPGSAAPVTRVAAWESLSAMRSVALCFLAPLVVAAVGCSHTDSPTVPDVVIVEPPRPPSITPSVSSLAIGDTLRLVAHDPSGRESHFRWQTNRPQLGAVDSTGLVSARVPGSLVVTARGARDSTVAATAVVEVRAR